jgi:hypothetical protein
VSFLDSFSKLVTNVGEGVQDLGHNPLKAIKDGLHDKATLTALAVAAGGYAAMDGGLLAGADATAATSATDAGFATLPTGTGLGATTAQGAGALAPAAQGAGALTSAAAPASSGIAQYATMMNAQKLLAGMQIAQALSAPKMPDATPPPKAAQTPGLQNARGNLAGAGGTPGVASTFLTGTSGVDPSLLNLGRSTLLGG